MAKKKPSKKEIKEELENYQKMEDMLNNLPEAKVPKKYKNSSLSKKEEFIKQLKHLLHEFMDSYVLIGFSVDGEETIIVENHGTPIETRGLNDFTYDFFSQYFDESSPSIIIADPDDLDE